MAFIGRIISWLTKAAALIGTIEAIIRLVRLAWSLFLRLLKRKNGPQVSFAGFRF